MKFFRILDNAIMKTEEFILAFAVILISVMTVSNVIAREVFHSGFFYFHAEVSKFALVIATFMGIAYAARKGRHISMSAFYDFGSFRVRKVMMVIIHGFTAVAMLILAYFTIELVVTEIERGTVTPSLQLPQYLMVIWVPFGFLMAGIQFLRNMWINIRVKEKVYLGIDAEDYNDKDNDEIAKEIQV